tara:strand:+ start:487 stop:828 length:342 start_codon:yes stop_codon:yes gene_type:complete
MFSVSCSTREEREARRAAEAKRLELQFNNACNGYGFEEGTAQFNQCMQLERRAHEQKKQIARVKKQAEWAEFEARQAAARADQATANARRTEFNRSNSCLLSGGTYMGGGTCW